MIEQAKGIPRHSGIGMGVALYPCTMNTNDRHGAEETGTVCGPIGAAEIAAETLVGAAIGAGIGVVAGPPGVVAGAMFGGTIAAVVGARLHEELMRLRGGSAR